MRAIGSDINRIIKTRQSKSGRVPEQYLIQRDDKFLADYNTLVA